jgi:hypothetical protein
LEKEETLDTGIRFTMAETRKLDDGGKPTEAHEMPSIHEAPAAVLDEGSLDPVYEAKARILNKAIQDIGMGRYQWQVRIEVTNLPKHYPHVYISSYPSSFLVSSNLRPKNHTKY